MKKLIYLTLLATLTMPACVVPEHPGRARIIVPPLPSLVILEIEPYYYFQGYHYHYKSNHWYYSHAKGGPWLDLPLDLYPIEIRFKDRDKDRRHYWNREYNRYEDQEREKEREPRHEKDRQPKDNDRDHKKERDHNRKEKHDRK